MELGKMLSHYCKARGLTMAQLAREAKVPKATVHGWFTGRSALKPEQLKRVATVLEAPLHELVFGEPDPYQTSPTELLTELFKGDVRVSIQQIRHKTSTR